MLGLQGLTLPVHKKPAVLLGIAGHKFSAKRNTFCLIIVETVLELADVWVLQLTKDKGLLHHVLDV